MHIYVSLCPIYLMPGASNNGGEDSPGGVIPGKSSLAHAGAVVNNKSGNILVTHLELDLEVFVGNEKQL